MKKLILFTTFFSVFFIPYFAFSEVDKKNDYPQFSQDIPDYNPPIVQEEKQRREFGDAKGTNRGIRVRGIKVRGVKVRGVKMRGVKMRGVKMRGVKARGVKTRGTSIDSPEIASLADKILEDFGLYTQNDEINDSEILPIPRRISPLAPEQTGFTTKNQPNLSWYISDPWKGKMIVKINICRQKKPLFVTEINGPGAEGIYHVDLSEYNVRLEENIDYEWLIAIITDPDEPSADIYTTATIRYVQPEDTLLKELDSTDKKQHYRIYAKHGYWYNAIDQLSTLIDTNPEIDVVKHIRAGLLKKVNLPNAAAFDNKTIPN